MKSIMGMYTWLNTATSGIRFGPDQEAVRRELQEHIEDKTADLLRIFPDMGEEEAGARALAEMGDAEELKIALAKIHRPWLGWLWRLTQVLVYGALALALITGAFALYSRDGFHWESIVSAWEDRREQRAAMEALFGDGAPAWEGERLALYAPEAEGRLGRAAVSVPRAAWWRIEGEDILYLQLRVTWDRPWEAADWAPYWFTAADDQGVPLESAAGSVWAEEEGLSWRSCTLRLKGLSREAQAVRLTYLPGTNFDLTVDLSREVEP